MTRRCSSKHCRRDARKGRTICTTCDSRKRRATNPMFSAYRAKRHNARRKGKLFTITFEDFKQFCYRYPYMAGKGRSGVSFGIDCIDPAKGYVPGNLQLLTNAENSRKGKRVLMYDWETKYAVYI